MEALKKENNELKKAIKQLTVEKNMLEDQLYRAFRRCLNAKKRKIAELQSQLATMTGNDNSDSPAKRSKPAIVESDEDTGDSDETTVDSDIVYLEEEKEDISGSREASPDKYQREGDKSKSPINKSSVLVLAEERSSSSDEESQSLLSDPVSKEKEQKRNTCIEDEGDTQPLPSDDYDLEDLTKDL